MEYVDSWLFNRGQEITLRKGPKSWRVTVQLMNTRGNPFIHLTGKDEEKLLLRALALIKEDVAKDDQQVVLLDQYHEHGSNKSPFPINIRTESDEIEEFVNTPDIQKVIQDMRTNIVLNKIERDSYGEDSEKLSR